MKKFIAILLAVVMALSVAGCAQSEPEKTTPTTEATQAPTTEATQAPTTVATEPEETGLSRVVSYVSSLNTLLIAFDKTDALVGSYGSEAGKYNVTSCGEKYNEVDVETVISLEPDALFINESYLTDDQKASLQQAGIELYYITLGTMSTAADEVAQLGELFGCEEKAQIFVDLYNTYNDLLTERLANVEPKNIYVEGTSSANKTANSTTMAHEFIVGAGGVNIAADNETSYPERDLEWVIAQNPDAVVKFCGSSTTAADSYAEYVAGLEGVACVADGNVILLNYDVTTTAFGSVIGRLYVAKFLYPDVFADVDVDAVYESLYTDFLGTEYPGSGAYTG